MFCDMRSSKKIGYCLGKCSLQISVSPHSDIYCLIVDEEWRGLWEVEVDERSRSGLKTELKSPPRMIWEL